MLGGQSLESNFDFACSIFARSHLKCSNQCSAFWAVKLDKKSWLAYPVICRATLDTPLNPSANGN